jgi:hypothetical protein
MGSKMQNEMQSNNFTVGLPYRADGRYDIGQLLSNILSELKKDTRKDLVRIEELYYSPPYSKGYGPRLVISYGYEPGESTGSIGIDDDDLMESVEAHRLPPSDEKTTLTSITYRMKMGSKYQADGVKLLTAIANLVAVLGAGIKVHDLIYHECLEENGIERPFISLYFST